MNLCNIHFNFTHDFTSSPWKPLLVKVCMMHCYARVCLRESNNNMCCNYRCTNSFLSQTAVTLNLDFLVNDFITLYHLHLWSPLVTSSPNSLYCSLFVLFLLINLTGIFLLFTQRSSAAVCATERWIIFHCFATKWIQWPRLLKFMNSDSSKCLWALSVAHFR